MFRKYKIISNIYIGQSNQGNQNAQKNVPDAHFFVHFDIWGRAVYPLNGEASPQTDEAARCWILDARLWINEKNSF